MISHSTASRHRAGLGPRAFRLALAAFATSLAPYAAASEIVLGDSIGVGVSVAAGLPRLAKPSVSLRGEALFEQLRQAPRGATVYLALGTNDAFDSARIIAPTIDRIVAAAERADLRLVWIGPPCVRRKWNHKAQALDAVLRKELAGRALYVSMTEPRFCEAAIKAADGVHFTLRGYRAMWAKTRAAATADAAPTGSIVPMTSRSGGVEGAARD